ncbi:16S rRNA (cytosine(967)-C(5))-methyltransferase RsmB [Idiomarina seosinensis]|uniref:16S rRNA (cytosine(967)-C(5))-methyltransferase RsmB n=1 Tax=Idiomarina seosinensis TaxID=281739 RepID=UPI00384FD75F
MTKKNRPASGAQSRAIAAKIVFRVLEQGESLSAVLPEETQPLEVSDRRLAQAISYGVMRYLPSLNQLIAGKLKKPLSGKLKILNSLLLVGAYQLYFLRTKDHAAVSASVEAAKFLGRKNHTGLVNGVLRQLLREAPERGDNQQRALPEDKLHNHPRWLAEAIKQDYPDNWQELLFNNNQHPPMWLRVNENQVSRAAYQQLLDDEEIESHPDDRVSSALRLTQPVAVERLPGFSEGWVSVQDRSAQLAGFLLNSHESHRVLDCCAAPGGKTLHLLERHQFTEPLTAIDIDQKRLQRVEENLARQKQPATLICADITATDKWWDGVCYDRILLDAPCSATGVIRRHPDIKWLRRASDIDALVKLQAQILDSIWPLLKDGGELLYATCSVLARENQQQIEHFLRRQKDARLSDITEQQATLQLLPAADGGDGFFYARLKKQQ